MALGERLPMIGWLLGHNQVETTARYVQMARMFGAGSRGGELLQHRVRHVAGLPGAAGRGLRIALMHGIPGRPPS